MRCALDSFCIAIVPPEKLDSIYISHVFPVSDDRICVDVTDRMKLTWRCTFQRFYSAVSIQQEIEMPTRVSRNMYVHMAPNIP
jgi:hypothetical protein